MFEFYFYLKADVFDFELDCWKEVLLQFGIDEGTIFVGSVEGVKKFLSQGLHFPLSFFQHILLVQFIAKFWSQFDSLYFDLDLRFKFAEQFLPRQIERKGSNWTRYMF